MKCIHTEFRVFPSWRTELSKICWGMQWKSNRLMVKGRGARKNRVACIRTYGAAVVVYVVVVLAGLAARLWQELSLLRTEPYDRR